MFEKFKAIAIVRRMIVNAKALVREAEKKGFSINGNDSEAECAMVALAVVFSDIYTQKKSLGEAIVQEALVGSRRQFPSEKQRQEYGKDIESLSAQYMGRFRDAFNRSDLDEVQKLETAYNGVCQLLAKRLGTELTAESEESLMLAVLNVSEYLVAMAGKR